MGTLQNTKSVQEVSKHKRILRVVARITARPTFDTGNEQYFNQNTPLETG
jgi:hypothetical protein